MKPRKAYHALCWALGVAGILLFAFSYRFQPGKYNGTLWGYIMLFSDETNYLASFKFTSQTEPQWHWKKPNNFAYETLDLTINSTEKATLRFPSLICEHENSTDTFSQDLLIELLNADPQTQSDEAFQEQLNKLFSLILSAGNGSLPVTDHNIHHFDSPFFGHLQQSRSGSTFLAFFGPPLLAIAMVLWFVGTLKRSAPDALGNSPMPYRRLTTMSEAILVNHSVFAAGALLHLFSDRWGQLGTNLCAAALIIAAALIPASIIYSFVFRYRSKYKQWDILAPALSIFLFMIIILCIFRPH